MQIFLHIGGFLWRWSEGGVGGRDAGGVVLNLIKNICSRLGSFKTFNLYQSIKVVFPIILNYNHVL